MKHRTLIGAAVLAALSAGSASAQELDAMSAEEFLSQLLAQQSGRGKVSQLFA